MTAATHRRSRPGGPVRPAGGFAAWTALIGLVLWGVIHVAGGVSLLLVEVEAGLETLAPNAVDPAPARAGDAAAGLLRFHSLNIALGGVAVSGLAIAWWRSRQRWQLDVGLGIALALDVGLIAFLVVPGLLPASQGLIGPVLVVVAIVGANRTRNQTSNQTSNHAVEETT